VAEHVSGISHAVFLSYASQDAQAAQKICEALRAAGIEVWFDQSELRGGDAWDQSIRKQIKTCALFLPVISHTTHDRREGYFRFEWKLAIDRCHLMDANLAFLLPVVIDDTRDDDERVPERFREVQWTRLPRGITPAAFVERVQRLLSGELSQESTGTASAASRVPAAPSTRKPVLASWRLKSALLATIAVVVVALGYLVANRLLLSKRAADVGAGSGLEAQNAAATATAFHPPLHSIAVLPFVNMSGDKEQEYFSDGLTEELLNALTEVNELQVAARTSAFSFKGTNADIGTIARKLNVSAVLEGSVRRSGSTVRITAQLINAVTGFHLWSHTYDRDLGDVLKLETEIAHAVASALKVSLLGDLATKIELGGTRNPAAFDAYLRGSKIMNFRGDANGLQTAIAAFTEAIRLDPNYALAFAGRSLAHGGYATEFALGAAIRDGFDRALADARRGLALAPELAEGHRALAYYYSIGALDFSQAIRAYDRALALAPGDARVVRDYARFAVTMGRTDAGLAAAHHAVVLDPLNSRSHRRLGQALFYARRYDESVAALNDALALEPDEAGLYGERGLAFYVLGDFNGARATCESGPPHWVSEWCLAVAYEKLGRHVDAEAAVAKFMARVGDGAAYQYATIYAQWGDRAKALEWLETALHLRDSGLSLLKTDPLMDPLRKEPRFKAAMQKLRFPD
jgi:TolB-like protein/Flp pilus assembly protein TadD